MEYKEKLNVTTTNPSSNLNIEKKTDKRLKGLFIPQKLLYSNLERWQRDCYAYIIFRLKHPSVEWTISIVDLSDQLNIGWDSADKFVKNGLKNGWLSKGEKCKCYRGWYYKYMIDRKLFKKYYETLVDLSFDHPLATDTKRDDHPLATDTKRDDHPPVAERPSAGTGVQEVDPEKVVGTKNNSLRVQEIEKFSTETELEKSIKEILEAKRKQKVKEDKSFIGTGTNYASEIEYRYR